MIPFEYDVEFQADVFLSELAGEEKYIGVGGDGKVKAMPNPGGQPISFLPIKVLDFTTSIDAFIPVHDAGGEYEQLAFPLLTNNNTLPGALPNQNRIYIPLLIVIKDNANFTGVIKNFDYFTYIDSIYYYTDSTMDPTVFSTTKIPFYYLSCDENSQNIAVAGIKGTIYYYEIDLPNTYDESGHLTNPIWHIGRVY